MDILNGNPTDLANQYVYASCEKYKACSGTTALPKNLVYLPASNQANPCLKGKILCPHFDSEELECEITNGAAIYDVDVQFGDQEPMYLPGLPNGKNRFSRNL